MNENTYDVSSIKSVSKKFLEVSLCSRAKQRQRNVQKNCEVAFLLIRPIVDFYRSPALPSPLSIRELKMETFSERRRPDWQRKPGTKAAVASRQK